MPLLPVSRACTIPGSDYRSATDARFARCSAKGLQGGIQTRGDPLDGQGASPGRLHRPWKCAGVGVLQPGGEERAIHPRRPQVERSSHRAPGRWRTPFSVHSCHCTPPASDTRAIACLWDHRGTTTKWILSAHLPGMYGSGSERNALQGISRPYRHWHSRCDDWWRKWDASACHQNMLSPSVGLRAKGRGRRGLHLSDKTAPDPGTLRPVLAPGEWPGVRERAVFNSSLCAWPETVCRNPGGPHPSGAGPEPAPRPQ